VHTEDPDGRDPFTKNPFAFVVAGADRTFGGRLNVNTQYLFRYLSQASERTDRADFATAVAIQQHILNGQTRRAQHGLSFRVSYNWLHETLEAECAAAAYARPSGAAVAPEGRVCADGSLEGTGRRRNSAGRDLVALRADARQLHRLRRAAIRLLRHRRGATAHDGAPGIVRTRSYFTGFHFASTTSAGVKEALPARM
jgi:hypothetical protein